MPEAVGVDRAEPCPARSGPHDRRHPDRAELAVRSESGYEHRSAPGCPRPAIAQVVRQFFPDVGRQRQAVDASGLAPDDELASSPVDVVQAEGSDLASAQAEAGEQREDRQVPPPGRVIRIAGGEQGGDLARRQCLGEPGERPPRR